MCMVACLWACVFVSLLCVRLRRGVTCCCWFGFVVALRLSWFCVGLVWFGVVL